MTQSKFGQRDMGQRDMGHRDIGLTVVGNALVDILARVPDAFIHAQPDMTRGQMTLVDAMQADRLARLITRPESIMSGGSAANTLSGFASFGGSGAFIGKVADDDLGRVFRQDMAAQSLSFSSPAHAGPEPTGSCHILVTPDGERTMNTHLGASVKLNAADIDAYLIARSETILLEGYALDHPDMKAAFLRAAALAQQAGTKIAFTLSDAGCVARHRDHFVDIVRDRADIVFANEREARALTLKDDFDSAMRAMSSLCDYAVVTRGGKGAVIADRGTMTVIPPAPATIIDTTGAGDAFAAGILAGLHRGLDPAGCGELAARAASVTIGHFGARNASARFSQFLQP